MASESCLTSFLFNRLHDFVWHGTDPENKTRKIPGALRFNKLQVIPDQFYYNVSIGIHSLKLSLVWHNYTAFHSFRWMRSEQLMML